MLPLLTTFSPPPCLNSLPKHSARETRCIRTSADAMKLERQVEIDMLRLSLQDGQSTTVPRHAGRIPSATKPPQYKFRRGHKNKNDMPLHCLRVPLRRIHVYNLLPTALIKSFGYRLVSGYLRNEQILRSTCALIHARLQRNTTVVSHAVKPPRHWMSAVPDTCPRRSPRPNPHLQQNIDSSATAKPTR